MSKPHLPRETLDHITDLLRNERETLKQCCLVSKPWVPRTQKYLFAYVRFRSASNLESWKETFPDVANTPACHTRRLLVGCPWLVVAADAEEGGWIRAFSAVASLEITVASHDLHFTASKVSLAPFHNFSPTLKSLRVDPTIFQYPRLFDLVLSFPLLVNLSLVCYYGILFGYRGSDGPQSVVPSTSPALSGNLNFCVTGGAGKAARRLLDLPNGLHFRRIALSWDLTEDVEWVTELVALCSHSLEYLNIIRTPHSTSICILPMPIT